MLVQCYSPRSVFASSLCARRVSLAYFWSSSIFFLRTRASSICRDKNRMDSAQLRCQNLRCSATEKHRKEKTTGKSPWKLELWTGVKAEKLRWVRGIFFNTQQKLLGVKRSSKTDVSDLCCYPCYSGCLSAAIPLWSQFSHLGFVPNNSLRQSFRKCRTRGAMPQSPQLWNHSEWVCPSHQPQPGTPALRFARSANVVLYEAHTSKIY